VDDVQPQPQDAADEALARLERELKACRQQMPVRRRRAAGDLRCGGDRGPGREGDAAQSGRRAPDRLDRTRIDWPPAWATWSASSTRQGNGLDPLSPDSNWHFTMLRRRDGHVVLVDGNVSPIVDDQRRAHGSVITFRNVTAAKRLTDELTHQAHHDPLTGCRIVARSNRACVARCRARRNTKRDTRCCISTSTTSSR
jgi:hypothetical protein